MNEAPYKRLEEVINDALFPEVDTLLRQGRHIDREDGERYAFLCDAADYLEPLYRRYGCDLVRVEDGYFYLLPHGDKLRRRQLTLGEMLLGKVLALLYLDPATAQSGGVVPRTHVLGTLIGLVGQETLLRRLNPRRKRRDERTEQEAVRLELDRAVGTLCGLGFVERLDEERLRLHAPVLRFSESVRGLGDPRDALATMIREGKAAPLATEGVKEQRTEEEDEES